MPATASAATATGGAGDPAGDQAAGGAVADVVGFEASYDDAGTITGRVRLAAAPPASATGFVFAFFGRAQPDGSCATAVGAGDVLGAASSSPTWGTPADPTGGGPATRTMPDATTIVLSAGGAGLARQPWNCAFASTVVDGATADRTAPVALRVPVPSPPPPTTPAPTTPAPPPSAPATARLELGATAPTPMRRDRWTRLAVTLRNAGNAPASGAQVRLRPPRGVKVSPGTRKIGALAAGATRTLRFRVKLTRRARSRSALAVTASAGGGGATARRSIDLRVLRRAARLTVAAVGAPAVRGRAVTVRLRVANAGNAPARAVRLRLTGSGVSISAPRRSLGTLRAGARRTVTVRVRRTGRAAGVLRARLTGAGGRAARTTVRLPAAASPGTRGPAGSGLSQRVFLRLVPGSPGVSQDRREGYAFTDGRWVYRGNPEGGIPRCTAKTAGVDADGDPTDGCLPYSFDPKSGKLAIDGKPATLDAARTTLKVGEEAFLLKPTLAPGARLALTLKNIEVYGLFPNQTVFTSWLTLTAGGEFALGGSAIGSAGAGSPSVISSTVSPDQRGTYEILSGSAIELRYADGKVARRTILIDGTPEDPSKPLDPQEEGLLLDGTPYWKP